MVAIWLISSWTPWVRRSRPSRNILGTRASTDQIREMRPWSRKPHPIWSSRERTASEFSCLFSTARPFRTNSHARLASVISLKRSKCRKWALSRKDLPPRSRSRQYRLPLSSTKNDKRRHLKLIPRSKIISKLPTKRVKWALNWMSLSSNSA